MKQLIFSLSALGILSGALKAQDVVAPLPPNNPVELRVAVNLPKPPTPPSFPLITENTQETDGQMKSKTFTKTFALDNSDKVNLSNLHGSITIKPWHRKEIKVDIDIKGYSTTDAEAQKLIDEVNVEANKSGDVVTFKTIMKEHNYYGKQTRNGNIISLRELKVNYVVYMPITTAVTAAQQYGSITAGSLSGPTSFKVQYGNLTVNTLSSTNNYLSVQYGNLTVQDINKAVVKQQYGKAVTIGTIGTLDLNVQYAAANITTIKENAVIKVQYGGGLNVGSVENLDLDAQYAKTNFKIINGSAGIKQQYGSLNIGTIAGKLNFIGQYSGAIIGSIKSDANINMEYDKLTINEVGAGCKALNIKSEYVGVVLGFAENYSANVEVNTDYAGFKYGSYTGIKSTRDAGDRRDSSKNYYNGKIGNVGNGLVRIYAEYGGITFK